jgi:hypothetical protein
MMVEHPCITRCFFPTRLNPLAQKTCFFQVVVRFDANTANYSCECVADPFPGCMSSWNKLWGASRCGKLNPRHEDSNRFVWRRVNTSSRRLVSIAAYAYDKRTNPYNPPDSNLLQPFDTPLAVGKPYLLSMVRSLSRTMIVRAAGASLAAVELPRAKR